MSLRARLLNQWLRRVEKPAMIRAKEPAQLRRRLELNARLFFHAPRGTQMQWQELQHAQRRLRALDIVPPDLSGETVLLYIHGGGFVFGSPRTHAAMLAHLGKGLGVRAVLPEYRLAPEAPFPASVEDVRTAWEALCASGLSPDQIVLGGDSAGGALALSLLGQLVADGAPMPAGVFCFSPFTDMTFSGASFRQNADIEAVLPAVRADEIAEMYLAGHDPKDPRVSPLFARYAGACPVWITVGDTEILRDDARRMVDHLRDEKVPVTFEEHSDLPHVWPIFHNILPEARQTLDTVAKWIRQVRASTAEN